MVLFMPSSAFPTVVFTIVDVAEVLFSSVVVSVVGIDIVAFVSLKVVVSAVVIEPNDVELPPPAAVVFVVVITIDFVDILADVVPLFMLSVVVYVVGIGIGGFTCRY